VDSANQQEGLVSLSKLHLETLIQQPTISNQAGAEIYLKILSGTHQLTTKGSLFFSVVILLD
jgi:hypothetical protein